MKMKFPVKMKFPMKMKFPGGQKNTPRIVLNYKNHILGYNCPIKYFYRESIITL